VPLTGPSHATMLTGLYPISHGLRNNGTSVLSPDVTLISEVLHERGFQTAAIVSALVLASSFGLDQGWDLYYEDGISGTRGHRSLWADQRPGDKTMDRALTWLKAEGDRPFLLWVHLFDPHDPYEPPSPFKEKYPNAPYDGEVAFADAQVGRLIAALREMKRYDDTLVIAAGDHGEGLGEHGERYHAMFLYNTTTHVPLIVRAPGGRRGVVATDLASTLDITPTILQALRLPVPDSMKGMQGVSLYEAATRGARVPARSLYLETIYPSASYGWSAVRALVQPSWKMIDLQEPELYDETGDPGEQDDLHRREPARLDELRSEYAALKGDLEGSARKARAAAIDDETRDRLISLGYIGGQQSEARAATGPDPRRMVFMMTPINIAMRLVKEKKYEDSEKIYRKVLEVDPDNRIGLIQMAASLLGQKRIDEAIPYYEHALATYPDVEEFYRLYGWMLMRIGRLDGAQDVFQRALKAVPESSHMHFMLGYARFLKGDWDGATPELDLSSRLNEKFGKPRYLLAICRLQKGDRAGALAALADYLRLDADVDSLFRDPYFAGLRGTPEFQDLVKKYL